MVVVSFHEVFSLVSMSISWTLVG